MQLYAQPSIDDGITLPLAQAERIFERMQRYPDYTLHVAEREGAVVGSIALLIMDNLGHMGAPSAVLEDVVVDPACQRRGIGRAMLAYVLDIARSRGCYKLALSSNQKRVDAHAFYESLGFRRHGYSFVVEA
ncbi:MAG TPA: GNAT family N-acetyltransferase [Burkholderiaceae bacterium]|nr:GNAT family N-acetyltransferase [Burkholderiaceae bacterium]